MSRGSPKSSDRPPEQNSLQKRKELLKPDDAQSESVGKRQTRAVRRHKAFILRCKGKRELRRDRTSVLESKRGAVKVVINKNEDADRLQGAEDTCVDDDKAEGSSKGESETLSLPPSVSLNSTETANVPKSILKNTNCYDLKKPIEGISEQEIIDIKNTAAKSPAGGKKCQKVSF